jgi:hypothetical protein
VPHEVAASSKSKFGINRKTIGKEIKIGNLDDKPSKIPTADHHPGNSEVSPFRRQMTTAHQIHQNHLTGAGRPKYSEKSQIFGQSAKESSDDFIKFPHMPQGFSHNTGMQNQASLSSLERVS